MIEAAASVDKKPLIVGRYALFDALASGGMATVHLGRLLGAVDASRTVAVKRLHAQYTTDQDFVTMFMDEARIVSRIRHPNVVPMVDVVESNLGLFLVMEYIHGEALSRLLRACRANKEAAPIKIVSTILHGVLLGLHAAHETKGAVGELLDVVHRDVSPQNIIVGIDGVARVLDFGVAKAAGRAQVTREGQLKGKLTYMSPEQIRGKVDRRADVFAASVVLWEALAGRRLHEGMKDVEIVTSVIKGNFPRPSKFRPDIPPALEEITMRGLDVDPTKRYQDAREMALEIEGTCGLAPPGDVGQWVERLAKNALQSRAEKVAAMEQASSKLVPVDSLLPPPEAPPQTTEGDAPSSPGQDVAPVVYSSVSSVGDVQTGTSAGAEVGVDPSSSSRADLATVIVLSFCGALALVGVVLGGWSLMARKALSANSISPSASTHGHPSAPPSAKPPTKMRPATVTSDAPSAVVGVMPSANQTHDPADIVPAPSASMKHPAPSMPSSAAPNKD